MCISTDLRPTLTLDLTKSTSVFSGKGMPQGEFALICIP